MAQHDMNIANQGFPGFRADLNNALAALVSNSSGATAPATTFAHQLWVDTSANPSVLKIRNADNDAFITIGTINQTNDKFKLTPADGVSTDTISELTAAAGVTIDGVLLKDTTVTANTVKASGTASSQGKVEFFEDSDNGTNFVALQAPAAIAADVTFTLPAADGTNGQVIQTNGSGTLSFATAGGGITSGTAVASTSGTSITFTGIPAYAKRITVMFNGVSTNGTSFLQAQLGSSSGGIETTGYNSSMSYITNAAPVTSNAATGFLVSTVALSGQSSSGMYVFTTLGNNIWVGAGNINDATTRAGFGSGTKTLSSTLDRIRIITVNGTDTFDAGSINILYE